MRTKNKAGYGRDWTEDEFILSLDLYYRTDPKERDDKNQEVMKLAHYTNRTPASIVYRLGNYSAIDPKADVKGFDNGGKTVKEMFLKYSADRKRLKDRAAELLAKYSQQSEVYAGGIEDYVADFDEGLTAVNARLKECDRLQQEFLVRWPKDKLKDILTLSNYVIGNQDTDSFCYWVERKTKPLGSILGATADKFKVYWDKETEDYKWIKEFGSAEDAFKKTKEEILFLLEAANRGDLEAIKNNLYFKNSHMYRGKLLYLYYPDRFLNVFSEDDIDFFLNKLGVVYSPNEHIIDKQNKLLQYKSYAEGMSGWSNIKFGQFLYATFNPPSKTKSKSFYAKKKNNKDEKEILFEEGPYVLPKVELTELRLVKIQDVVPAKKKASGRIPKGRKKSNYIAESIRNKKLGDQGEEIVLKYEQEMLRASKRHDLAEKVKRVSLDDDSLGYDIKSFTLAGQEKLIDVKATSSGVEGGLPFYITENELTIMNKNAGSYYLYRVFAANTPRPMLLIINNELLKSKFEMKVKLWEVSVV